MTRLFLGFFAVMMTACSTIQVTTGTIDDTGACVDVKTFGVKTPRPQVSVVVRVGNDCPATDYITIDDVYGSIIECLPFGRSTTVVLVSKAFTGPYRQMVLISKGFTSTGKYLGSTEKHFGVSTYRGSSFDNSWSVNRLNLPGGGGCEKR